MHRRGETEQCGRSNTRRREISEKLQNYQAGTTVPAALFRCMILPRLCSSSLIMGIACLDLIHRANRQATDSGSVAHAVIRRGPGTTQALSRARCAASPQLLTTAQPRGEMPPVKSPPTFEAGSRDAGWRDLRLAALCVGVGAYAEAADRLGNTVSDAEAVYQAINACAGCRAAIIRDPADKKTIRKHLRHDFLDALAASPPDVVFVFLAGHGVQVGSLHAYLIPECFDAHIPISCTNRPSRTHTLTLSHIDIHSHIYTNAHTKRPSQTGSLAPTRRHTRLH